MTGYSDIEFYQNEEGKIVKIDADKFARCAHQIYREAAKDELPSDQKRKLVGALLKGEAINDTKSIKQVLKNEAGTCTYGERVEQLGVLE